jgi:hypothetical protein
MPESVQSSRSVLSFIAGASFLPLRPVGQATPQGKTASHPLILSKHILQSSPNLVVVRWPPTSIRSFHLLFLSWLFLYSIIRDTVTPPYLCTPWARNKSFWSNLFLPKKYVKNDPYKVMAKQLKNVCAFFKITLVDSWLFLLLRYFSPRAGLRNPVMITVKEKGGLDTGSRTPSTLGITFLPSNYLAVQNKIRRPQLLLKIPEIFVENERFLS